MIRAVPNSTRLPAMGARRWGAGPWGNTDPVGGTQILPGGKTGAPPAHPSPASLREPGPPRQTAASRAPHVRAAPARHGTARKGHSWSRARGWDSCRKGSREEGGQGGGWQPHIPDVRGDPSALPSRSWLPSAFLQLLLNATNQPRGPGAALDLPRAPKPWLCWRGTPARANTASAQPKCATSSVSLGHPALRQNGREEISVFVLWLLPGFTHKLSTGAREHTKVEILEINK